MKKMKRILVLIVVFLLIPKNTFASTKTYTRTNDKMYLPSDVTVTESNRNDILNTPAVNSSEKIYDFANILSDEEEEKLFNQIKEYMSESNMDAVIVTTKDLNGFSISNYAYNFYDYNDFLKDGTVLVISTGGEEPSIFMGISGDKEDEIFSIYPSETINKILKYIYPNFKNGTNYKGLSDYIKLLKGFYEKVKGSSGGEYTVGEDAKVVKKIPWIEILVLSTTLTFVLTFFIYYHFKEKNKISNKKNIEKYIDESTLMVKTIKDEKV